VDFAGKDVADVGAGTGRLTLLLEPFIRSALLTDDAAPMLDLAREKLARVGFDRFRTHVGDLATIPAEDAALDVVLAGWALCGKALRGDPWPDAVREVLAEIRRVLRPGGTTVIIESLGTGQERPSPPNPRFADYFRLLEAEGFRKACVRTDYRFASREEKERLLTFFFDRDMLDAGVKNDALIYPEWTGIWVKQVGGEIGPEWGQLLANPQENRVG
jgi:ubiquinone/menaquinone biosynthesis C-methylase UbiE